jgi:hypothetical protein
MGDVGAGRTVQHVRGHRLAEITGADERDAVVRPAARKSIRAAQWQEEVNIGAVAGIGTGVVEGDGEAQRLADKGLAGALSVTSGTGAKRGRTLPAPLRLLDRSAWTGVATLQRLRSRKTMRAEEKNRRQADAIRARIFPPEHLHLAAGCATGSARPLGAHVHAGQDLASPPPLVRERCEYYNKERGDVKVFAHSALDDSTLPD